MEYLDKVLGIKVTYGNAEFQHLPNFISARYHLQKVAMNGQGAIFVYPKTALEQIGVLKKHIARIQKNGNLPVALILKETTSRQKEYLIREKIPLFVRKRILGTVRVLYDECTESQMLRNRKNFSMEECYDKQLAGFTDAGSCRDVEIRSKKVI